MLKLWKCFRIWKKAVNHAKFAYAKASLEKNLFMLSPVFQVRGGGGRGVGFMVGIKGKGRWRQVLAGREATDALSDAYNNSESCTFGHNACCTAY